LVSVNPSAMKKLIGILFVALLIPFLGFAQIGAKTQQTKIYGIWQTSSAGQQTTLMLNADGRGEFDGSEITFTVQGNKLSIVAGGATTVYTYLLQTNTLTVSGGDIEGKVIFTRNGTSSNETATASTPNPVSSNSIVGIWSGNNETIEFTKAGKCVYQGQVYSYQAANGNVTLQTAQGNLTMGYAVSGNQLSLTINNQTLNYSKNGAPVTGVTPSANTTTPTGGKQVAPELAGKWCYVNVNSTNSGGSSTEQCITLKADGTYEYYSESSRSVNTNAYSGGTNSQNSDRGTWSYDGSRIYYSSSMGAGSGSYLLEKRNHPKNNDPMIVLDGQTYVTQYQKAPWR
jgi:hypothetical protein